MLAHAVRIIQNELNLHLDTGYTNAPVTPKKVEIGNISMGLVGTSGGTIPIDKIIISVVNYREEKTLKNMSNTVRNDSTLRVTSENPPVFLNFILLFTATHIEYGNALIDLSKIFRFFQSKNVFTPDTISPSSLNLPVFDIDPMDHLESFKLIMELISPSFEEVNHLWGTLGGRQYPFILYQIRMLDLKYKFVQDETGVITEVQNSFYHLSPQINVE